MRRLLLTLLFAGGLGASSVACQSDEPECTGEEGESCASDYTSCKYNATHDTEVDTETDSDSDSTTELEEALAACTADYCNCLMFAGCDPAVVCESGTD